MSGLGTKQGNWIKAAAVLALLSGPARAQPAAPSAIETVTVTAEKIPAEIAHDFVQSYARMASESLPKLTRWKKPICVGTDGLSSEDLNLFVTQRVRQIAALAGMEVDSGFCKFNIEIIFSSTPQAFLDRVRVEGPALLTPRRSQLGAVAVMRHPLQAWYATGIEDLHGNLILNDEENAAFLASANSSGNGFGVFNSAPTMNVEGSILRNGISSQMAHVYVLADTNRTGDFRLGPIADYIAMLALTQAESFDTCKPLPSITNLFAANCGEALKPVSITDTDIAFLKGLYRMDPGANLQTQQSDIAREVEKALEAKKP